MQDDQRRLSTVGRCLFGGFLGILLGFIPIYAQRTEVYNVHSMPENSIVYALPETRIFLQIDYEKVTETPGDLALYAQRYLGVKDAIIHPRVYYTLNNLTLGTHGVPDEALRFSVKFNRRYDATNVTLTEDGLLLGINIGPIQDSLLPEDRLMRSPQRDRVAELSVFPPEYIQATTIAKKAEIAAEEIYRLREGRTTILSGQSDQPFPDGKALEIAVQRLDRAEQILTEAFIGKRDVTDGQKVISGIKISEDEKIVAFRFSEHYGILPAEDLRGEPIYLEIKTLEKAPELDDREQKRLERNLKNGIVYRVPGAVEANLIFRGQVLRTGRIAVAQFGVLETLDPTLFTQKDITTIVEFHSATGGIKDVSNRAK